MTRNLIALLLGAIVAGATRAAGEAIAQRAAHDIEGWGEEQAEGGDPGHAGEDGRAQRCLLYTSPSPRDRQKSRMPSSA